MGGHLGYGWDSFDDATTSRNPAGGFETSKISSHRSGIFGGGQFGYDYMLNPTLLLGVEADLDGADLSETHNDCLDPARCARVQGSIDLFGTARVRLGYVQDNLLLFATGGLAWEQSTARSTIVKAIDPTVVRKSDTESSTDAGWTAGAGVAYGFMPNWSLSLEYRYMQIDTSHAFTFPAPVTSVHVKSTDRINTIRTGLTYHFN